MFVYRQFALRVKVVSKAIELVETPRIRTVFRKRPVIACHDHGFLTPTVRMELGGEIGARTEAVLRNWILTAPEAHPGMLEMMRLRDRTPPYENP